MTHSESSGQNVSLVPGMKDGSSGFYHFKALVTPKDLLMST